MLVLVLLLTSVGVLGIVYGARQLCNNKRPTSSYYSTSNNTSMVRSSNGGGKNTTTSAMHRPGQYSTLSANESEHGAPQDEEAGLIFGDGEVELLDFLD